MEKVAYLGLLVTVH